MKSNRFGKVFTGPTPVVVLFLLSASLIASLTAHRSDKAKWHAHASHRVADALSTVAGEFARLETKSQDIARQAQSVFAPVRGGVPEDPVRRFAALDSILAQFRPMGTHGRGAQIGVQLIDQGGRVLAWAGWPRRFRSLDRMLASRATELFYTRRVSLYRVLTLIVPVVGNDGTKLSIAVDIPIEVNYRVNNRFLQSGSFADSARTLRVADMRFDYFPATGNLGERLPRYRAALDQRANDRKKRRARRRSTSRHTHGAHDDSTLTDTNFPAFVLPAGELAGNETSGLSGRVIAYAPQGNPLLGISVRSYPFAHDASITARHKHAFARAALLAALLVLFGRVLVLMGTPRQARTRVFLAMFWFTGVVALRYALLGFRGTTAGRAGWLFDPAVFATPVLGGILRSTGDLLITGGLLLVALYGVTRVVRGAHESDGTSGKPEFASGEEPHAWRIAGVSLAVSVVSIATMVELCKHFVAAVVINANPRLIGESMRLNSPEVLALHVGVFLVLSGIVLAGGFFVWSVVRAAGGGARALLRGAVGALAVLAVIGVVRGGEFALVGIPLAIFIAWAPRYVRREDLVSLVMVAFGLMVVTSISGYVFLTRNYDELRREFVEEKADELINPSDNWRVVILEDMLSQYARRPDIRQVVHSPGLPDARRLAFDLWAEGPLSLLGYSCAIHVIGPGDSVISRFEVDMPYRARIGEADERTDTPQGQDWAVLDLTRSTPRGIVRFYRGILNVHDMFGGLSQHLGPQPVGKVIIDLPFFFANLEFAARTGPRTPELLRNVQVGGVAPRVEEPDALLLARVEDGRVVESSTSRLTVGSIVPGGILDRARQDRWPLLDSGNATYRITARKSGGKDRILLVGYSAPSVARHILRAATLFSLYLAFAFAIIVLLVALERVRPLGRWLPSLLPGRRLGFQQKLLASFLVVALVPTVVLGIFGLGFIHERFVSESQREALGRAFSARKSLVNILHGEQQVYLGGADLDSIFSPARPPVQSAGPDRVVMRFVDTEDVLQLGKPTVSYAGATHDASTEALLVVRRGNVTWAGVMSDPFSVSEAGWTGTFYLVYARRLTRDLLARVAEQVGADVSVYDGGHLVASSQEGLLSGGFLSATMNARAYTAVSLQGADHLLTTERAGRYRFQVAYVPIARGGHAETSSGVHAGRPEQAALSVPLLFRPESYDREVQRATSLLLGIFALLFTATMTLGLVLARGIFEPLRALLLGTRRIARGEYDVHVNTTRADEIGTVVSAFNEMTARIGQSRHELEQRGRYLEVILESIGTGVIGLDAEGRIRTVNAAAQKIARVNADAVLGRAPESVTFPDAARSLFALFRTYEQQRFATGEIVLNRDGEHATVKYMLTRIVSVGGSPGGGAVLAVEDLTELIESKKMAAWVEMARQIAHEIKNPLTPIRISTQFMQRAYAQKPDQFATVFRESTETIMQQVDVLKRIAGEFSSYGRLQKLSLAPHPLMPLLEDILSAYRHNESGIKIHLEVDPPDLVVDCDAEATRKICANLVENAFQAMPDGGCLDISAEQSVRNGAPVVHVIFRDTGAGLDPSVAGRLFEPYFSTKTTGTGLGLAICRTLSREMGGDVQVANAVHRRGVDATLTLRAGQRPTPAG